MRRPFVTWLPAWVISSLFIGRFKPGIFADSVHWADSIIYSMGYTGAPFAIGYWVVKWCAKEIHPGWRALAGVLFAVLGLVVGPSMAHAAGRSSLELHAFQRHNPCPSTGKPRGSCPGWQIDHVTPLCAYGADKEENMQWLTIEEHRYKTRTDVRVCRQLRTATARP